MLPVILRNANSLFFVVDYDFDNSYQILELNNGNAINAQKESNGLHLNNTSERYALSSTRFNLLLL